MCVCVCVCVCVVRQAVDAGSVCLALSRSVATETRFSREELYALRADLRALMLEGTHLQALCERSKVG
jgi:hypothetical protein